MSINSVVNDTVTGESTVNAQKPKPPAITGYAISGADDTALDPAGGQTILLNGTGFQRGATVTLNGTAIAVVTYVNANQLSFTSPAVSAGTYTIYAVNADGGTGIYIPGLIYSNLPTWTTGAGSLGSYYETQTIASNVAASGDAPVTYSLFSGALPTGAVFNANGTISGSAPVDGGSTTYSFTVQATDAQLQDSTRSFSLTINTDVVTWSSPASGATYTPTVNSVMANIGLTATSAAGSAVSYSANSLPIGVSLTGNTISGTPTSTGSTSTLLTATATATSRSATRTINWTIAVASDSYFGYNTLLLQGADTFVKDSSLNNFAVSIFGDTKPNNNNPYTPYSNYFDGTDDFLSYSSNTTLNFGTGDFTVECWINLGNTTGSKVIVTGTASNAFGLRYGTGFGVNNGLSIYRASVADLENCSFSFLPNVWYHVAVVRQSGVIKFFVNGTQQTTAGSGGASYNYAAETSVRIGTGDTGLEDYIGYISNLRVTKSAVYTANFTPTTTPLAAIANTSLLTCQSNLFVDRSTNAFAITNNGNTLAQQFHPFTSNTSYSGYGSGYFDGTGDYLTAPNNAAFNFGTGDFTVECWVYVISFTGSTNVIISTYQDGSNGWTIGITSNVFYGAAAGDTAEVRSSVTPPVNIWTHLALTRSSTTLSLFINGVVAATQSNSTNMSTTSAVTIGTNVGGGALNFTGYITDVRVVKGTAVYTTTFTPPTAPLTAIANTSLLTLQNNQPVNNNVFLDNSTNNFLVTRNGNTTQGTFSPYGGNWSNYFDGGTNRLTTATSSIFNLSGSSITLECWVYITAAPSVYNRLITIGPNNVSSSLFLGIGTDRVLTASVPTGAGIGIDSGANVIPLNSWAHLAFTLSGDTGTLYINGTQVGQRASGFTITSTNSNYFYVGYDATATVDGKYTGYVSNVRLLVGTALYTSAFTPSTTPLTPITNTRMLTCQNNRMVDNSINNTALTTVGSISIQRYSPFNPASVTPTSYSNYFDGSGDYLSTPYNVAYAFGTGDFTVEFWVYHNAFDNYELYIGDVSMSTGRSAWAIGCTNALEGGSSKLYFFAGTSLTTYGATWTPATNTWYHIAASRSGTSLKLFVNGTQLGSTFTCANDIDNTYGSGTFYIGRINSDTAWYLNGYVSNLRVVKGTALYTANFTPSTTPLTAISDTSLLTCQSPTFIDNSTNNFTITAAGNSQPTVQNPFGYTSATTDGYTPNTTGGSAYFGGSSLDYLSIPGSVFAPTGDFSIMFWCYVMPSATGYMHALGNYTANTSTDWMFEFNFNPNGSMYVYNSGGATQVGTTGTIRKGEWTHVAMIRSGTTVTAYLNGVSLGTRTQSGTFGTTSKTIYIGGKASSGSWNGYITDVCLVNGTALYTSNFVPPSAPQTAVRNTSLLLNMTGAGVYDASTQNLLQTVGDARLSTSVSKFGGSSMSFDGTGDYLSIPNSAALNLSSGNFTIEAWVYWTGINAAATIIDKDSAFGSSYPSWNLALNGSSRMLMFVGSGNGISQSQNIVAPATFPSNQWVHVAGVKNGSTLTLYQNGVSVASATQTATIIDGGKPVLVGWQSGQPTAQYWDGYIDDLRITRGYARYTANFTPPTEAFMTK